MADQERFIRSQALSLLAENLRPDVEITKRIGVVETPKKDRITYDGTGPVTAITGIIELPKGLLLGDTCGNNPQDTVFLKWRLIPTVGKVPFLYILRPDGQPKTRRFHGVFISQSYQEIGVAQTIKERVAVGTELFDVLMLAVTLECMVMESLNSPYSTLIHAERKPKKESCGFGRFFRSWWSGAVYAIPDWIINPATAKDRPLIASLQRD